MNSEPERLVGIDVLRALAIIGVLVAHLGASGLAATPHSLAERLALTLSGRGDYGVILFFTISGFVITRTIINRDGSLSSVRLGAFYRRRLARLGPALAAWLALGAAALSLVPVTSVGAVFLLFGNAQRTPVFWFSIATFTFNFERVGHALATGHGYGLHWGILWSLSVEEQFYLAFPILVRRIRSQGALYAFLASLAAVSVVSRITVGYIPAVWLFPTPMCVDSLVIGVAAALLPDFQLTRCWAVAGAAVGLAVLTAGFLSLSFIAKPVIISAGAATIMASCRHGDVFTSQIWVPVARIGRVSYGMYLFHPLVMLALAPVLRSLPFLAASSVLVVAVTLTAEVSFAAIERPASRWIRDRRMKNLITVIHTAEVHDNMGLPIARERSHTSNYKSR